MRPHAPSKSTLISSRKLISTHAKATIKTITHKTVTKVKKAATKPVRVSHTVAKIVAPVIATVPTVTSANHAQLMAEAGITSSDYAAVDYIVSHESGWCPTKWEGEIGACPAFHGVSDYDGYGMCQSTPPQKMAVAGADWATNPVTQLKWCASYAIATYGGWWGAYYHWLANHNW